MTLELKPELNTGLSLSSSLNRNDVEPEAVITDPTDATKSATSCALCALNFSTLEDQRAHVRSDLHNYNLKQKLRGQGAVSGNDYEKLVGELGENLSGSDEGGDTSSDDEDEETDADVTGTGASKKKEKEKAGDTTLSALLRKQANLADPSYEEETKSRKMGSGNAPLLWFSSDKLPKNYNLGVYRALFTPAEQALDSKGLVELVKTKQLSAQKPTTTAKQPVQQQPSSDEDKDDGGVALPKQPAPPPQATGPHYFLLMIGGGHFAASIISLTPAVTRKNGVLDRSATVIAHKTFHRYTTRRKQGGSQSSNDASKGNAHSAGAGIRRYNEAALVAEVRELLSEWREMITSSELWFLRATGSTNRKTLFEHYEGRVLDARDKRIRGFPFSTKRATQKELVRAFVELTRVKTTFIDEDALRQRLTDEKAAKEKFLADAVQKSQDEKAAREKKKIQDAENEEQTLHTTQLASLIRRSKAPALLSYLASNSLSPDYLFWPHQGDPRNHHAPRPLHLAASLNSAVCVSALLIKAGADPTIKSGEAKTAFELAGDRATRDAFRLVRTELGESAWNWETACVPSALTKSEVETRAAREKEEVQAESLAEAERRKTETEKLREGDRKREEEGRDKKFGKGKSLGILAEVEKSKSAQEKREDEGRGMGVDMRAKLERERRARAAEARLGRR